MAAKTAEDMSSKRCRREDDEEFFDAVMDEEELPAKRPRVLRPVVVRLALKTENEYICQGRDRSPVAKLPQAVMVLGHHGCRAVQAPTRGGVFGFLASLVGLNVPAPVVRDYNNHRTRTLGSTNDRAVSLVTADVYDYLTEVVRPPASASSAPLVMRGDLGENVTLSGVRFDDLVEGAYLRFSGGCQLQITEPIEPCNRLKFCSWAHADLADPGGVGGLRGKPGQPWFKRVALMQEALGFRGWMARVLCEGDVRVGETATLVVPSA